MIHIADEVEKQYKEKNEGKSMPDFQKSKAREMERALENFFRALKHFSELHNEVDISGIKKDIKEEIEKELRYNKF
ncbi:MAG TPA: hypothetical protein DIT25_02995 [Candidatus Moranbacteria bacterium]|nr:hypothetical protein [Candidatus Moranbacteria bacterium]